jgi:RHS repeat-associated protein
MDSANAYIYGPTGTPLEQVNLSSGTVQYLISDALGSVRGVVDSEGSLTASTSYDAWGNPETDGGLASETPFGFAGGYTDPTGLIYLIGRYYDPGTGQFLNVDPLVDETGQPYAYTGDDPVNGTDPSGESGISAGTICGEDGPNSAACKGAQELSNQVGQEVSTNQVGSNKPIIDVAGTLGDAASSAVGATANWVKAYGVQLAYNTLNAGLGCAAGAVVVGLAGTVVPVVGNGFGLAIGCVGGAVVAVLTGGPWTDNPDDYGLNPAGAATPTTPCREE